MKLWGATVAVSALLLLGALLGAHYERTAGQLGQVLPPEKRSVATSDTAGTAQRASHADEQRAPSRTLVRTTRRAPNGAVTTRLLIHDAGAVRRVTDSKLDSVQVAHAEAREELRPVAPLAAPPAPPRWALSLGIDDVLGERALRVGAGMRAVGPIWIELAAVPIRRELGAGISVRW